MCEWRSKLNPNYRCRVSPLKNSKYCIFHEPDVEKKDVKIFKSELYKQINEVGPENERNPRNDFRGYVFPPGIAVRCCYEGEGYVIIPREIDGDLVFAEAIVEGEVCLERINVKGVTTFRMAEFKQGFSLRGATMKGKVYFNRALFHGMADFREAIFKDETYFNGAEFKLQAAFENCTFEKKLDLTLCQARAVQTGEQKPTILWTPCSLRLLPQRGGVKIQHYASAPLFWRFAREIFQSHGSRDRADAAHYFDRLTRMSPWQVPRKGCWVLKRLWVMVSRWLWDCLFLRWPTAYGASLPRLLTTWMILTLGFASVYYLLTSHGYQLFDHESPGEKWPFSFGRAFYFSIITFTTLGYGDIRPAPGLGSALTALEAILGGIMMALTVLVIGRKFMR